MLRRMWNSFLWVETWVRTSIFTIWHFFLPITQHTSSSVTPPESSAWEESHSILSKHGQDHDKVLERVHLIIYFSEHRKQQMDFNEPCECFFAKPQFDIIPQAFQGAWLYLPSSPSTFFLLAHYAQALLAFLFPGALSCIAAVINRGLSPNGVPRVLPHPSSPMVFFFQVSAFMSSPQRDLSVVPDPTSRSFSSQFLSQFPLFLFGY